MTQPCLPGPVARSFLFVPGDRPDRFDKAWDSDADDIILDLEDAVAAQAKPRAREAIAGWLDARRPVWLRVNAHATPDFAPDLELAQRPGIAGLMLAKAEDPLPALSALCVQRGLSLMPLIESAAGMHRVAEIAAMPGVVRLAFGSIDFQTDLGIEGEGDALLAFRSHLVLHSRLAHLAPPVDGVSTDINDESAIAQAASQSRALGFGGKLCIHPRQVAAVHRAFSPTAAQREWAVRVLAAMQASAGAAVAVDGRMVDRPVWLQATRIASANHEGPPVRHQAVARRPLPR
jgi:citrate lyase subunit beta/citryl-CoA lyase